MGELSKTEVREKAPYLVQNYPNDLEDISTVTFPPTRLQRNLNQHHYLISQHF
jgi:hypothetical protein